MNTFFLKNYQETKVKINACLYCNYKKIMIHTLFLTTELCLNQLLFTKTGGSDTLVVNLQSLPSSCFMYFLILTQYCSFLNYIFYSIHEVIFFIQDIHLQITLYLRYEFRHCLWYSFMYQNCTQYLQFIFWALRQGTNKYIHLVTTM